MSVACENWPEREAFHCADGRCQISYRSLEVSTVYEEAPVDKGELHSSRSRSRTLARLIRYAGVSQNSPRSLLHCHIATNLLRRGSLWLRACTLDTVMPVSFHRSTTRLRAIYCIPPQIARMKDGTSQKHAHPLCFELKLPRTAWPSLWMPFSTPLTTSLPPLLLILQHRAGLDNTFLATKLKSDATPSIPRTRHRS